MKPINEAKLPELDNIMYPRQSVGSFDEDQILKRAITAIALNKKLDLYIEKKFNSRSSKYYRAAYDHKWRDITQSICMADQIDRGLKVLGMWAVEGRKVLDDLLKRGWPDFWKACECFRKEGDITKIQNHFSKDIAEYDLSFEPVILLYFMYYFKMRDKSFPLALKESLMDLEALFYFKKPVTFASERDCENTERFCAAHDIYSDADDLDELMDLSTGIPNELCPFFSFPLVAAGINPFCLMGRSLERTKANILACELKKAFPKIRNISIDCILQSFYCIGYQFAIVCEAYDDLKIRYYTEKKKTLKLAVKTVSSDEKKIRKELEKSQLMIAKLNEENNRLREKIENVEALKRKLEAERDSEIKKAVKNNRKDFSEKEIEYQHRIEMLEEMLAEQIKENECEQTDTNFDEMLILIRETSGILYVCGNETAAGSKKIARLKELADNIKFFSSKSDPIPSEISYIFFDYHLISHNIYHKIKKIGKRNAIPIYNIQNRSADKNIAEMYSVIGR